MKQLFLAIFIVCVAAPAFAQDIDLGLGGDVSSLLNIPAPRGNTPARGAVPARGAAPARGNAPNTAPADRLMRLRELLAQGNMPLSKDQEAGLNALLNTEIPAMRQALQKRVLELQRAKATSAPPVPAPTADGQRGAPPAANLPSMEELTPEIIRLNDQLLGKISDAAVLSAEQRTTIRKLYKEQVK